MRSLKQEVCGLQQCVNARDSEGVRKSVRSISKLLCDQMYLELGILASLRYYFTIRNTDYANWIQSYPNKF